MLRNGKIWSEIKSFAVNFCRKAHPAGPFYDYDLPNEKWQGTDGSCDVPGSGSVLWDNRGTVSVVWLHYRKRESYRPDVELQIKIMLRKCDVYIMILIKIHV